MIISITLLWLILLLICATRASKSIEEITTKRFPLILVQPQQNVPWNGVEDYVLKSWIVARISSPESIISRSVLGSSAAMALTVCIAISVVEWVAQGPVLRVLDGPRFSLKFIITNLEVVFILIGWAVIFWRTLQSVGYYGRWRDKRQSWRDYFRVEDFWTRHIHQLQKAEESKRKLEVDKCVGKMIATEETEIFWLPKFLLKMLLKCMFWFEASVIFMSRISWFLTEIPFYIGSIILPQHSVKEDTEIEGYKHILDDIKIVRENSRSLFATNRKAIMQAKQLMTKGNNNGRSCHALVKLLRHSKKLDAKKYPALLNFFRPRRSQAFVCIQCSDLGTANNRTGLKFLCKRDPVPVLEVDKYFMHTSKRSLKLTAVSLINIIVHLCHPGGKDCLKAYHEACELMDLVEEWDTKADILLSKAASLQFKKLWEKEAGEHNPHIRTMEDAAVAIINLANESKQEAEMQINITHDKPVDWEKIVVANTLYKLCKSVDCRSGNLPELMDELENSLAYIIRACIERVGFALVESCRKWADNFEERKLLEAIYIAGKFEAVYMAAGLEQLEELEQRGWSRWNWIP